MNCIIWRKILWQIRHRTDRNATAQSQICLRSNSFWSEIAWKEVWISGKLLIEWLCEVLTKRWQPRVLDSQLVSRYFTANCRIFFFILYSLRPRILRSYCLRSFIALTSYLSYFYGAHCRSLPWNNLSIYFTFTTWQLNCVRLWM